MKKLALLIGVSHYPPGLAPLPSAEYDVQALQRVLQNPEIGGFDDVNSLLNPDLMQMQEAIESLFREREKDDLILLFFSGHGIKDEAGKLYLGTSATQKTLRGELVKASAVPAHFVYEILNNSRSKRQVVMLDCCFSGAFAEGMVAKDDDRVAVLEQLGGEGRAVLTSSTSTQYSLGQQGSGPSVYTRYIVEGLETGAADEDNDGVITIDELHDYAKRRVQESAPAMKPEIQTDKEGFRIRLARALIGDPRLRFRREVAKFADRGELSEIAQDALDVRRQNLGLQVEEAEAIRDEVLKPSRLYHQNLKRYERHFRDALLREFPLNPSVQGDLDYLQSSLGLRDEDVKPIVAHLTDLMRTQMDRGIFPEPTGGSVTLPSPQPPIASPTPEPILPAPPPKPPRPRQPVVKGLVAAATVLVISGVGAYGYRQWHLNQSGNDVFQQAVRSAQVERWGEAIAYLEQVPADSAVADQVPTKLEAWSNALLKQAEAAYAAGDVTGAIAYAQDIPPRSPIYAQAQSAIARWQQQAAADQGIFEQIQTVLAEQWDVNTARLLLPQIQNPRMKADAEALIRDIEQRSSNVEAQQRLEQERRRIAEERRKLERSELLNRRPDITLSEGYQYAWLSYRTVTEADLAGKSPFELYVMRNSIFARHGRIFKEEDLRQVFSAESWYRPVYTGDEFDQIENELTSALERQNAAFIRDYEERTGLCYGGC